MVDTAAYLGLPVSSLQAILRTLSFVHRDIPPLLPTGQFGPYTLEGVMVFQREAGLPVTGRVDYPTWTALVREYQEVSRTLSPPAGVAFFPWDGTEIGVGEESPLLYPMQGMLCALSGALGNFRYVIPTGRCDEKTVENIRTLQRCAGLEETGRFDRGAWESLSRLYETFCGVGRD